MATEQLLTLYQRNDETVTVTVTDADSGDPVDLSGADEITMYVKAAPTTEDRDATTYTLSTGVTVTDGPGGVCTVAIPAADLANNWLKWWRLDVTADSATRTAAYGKLRIIDL